MNGRTTIIASTLGLAAACGSSGPLELHREGAPPTSAHFPNPEYLTVVSWNVNAGECSNLEDELRRLVAPGDVGPGVIRSVDVLALQEAPRPLTALFAEEDVGAVYWGAAGGGADGLCTAARIEPLSSSGAAGSRALVTEYPLESGRTLLVVNMRASGAPGTRSYEKDLERVLERVGDHPDAVILCGDLQTFSQGRRAIADDATYAALRLRRARPVNAGAPTYGGWWPEGAHDVAREEPLVHLYFRGLFLDHCEWRNDYSGSGHPPLYATFRLPPLPRGDG